MLLKARHFTAAIKIKYSTYVPLTEGGNVTFQKQEAGMAGIKCYSFATIAASWSFLSRISAI